MIVSCWQFLLDQTKILFLGKQQSLHLKRAVIFTFYEIIIIHFFHKMVFHVLNVDELELTCLVYSVPALQK